MSEYKIDYCHHDSVTAESRQEYIKREDAEKLKYGFDVNMLIPKDMEPCALIYNDTEYLPVVRCKDCKYWRPDTRPEDSLEDRTDGLWGWGNLCVKHLPSDECEAIEFGPEEFCNFGERKEQERG